MRNFNYFHFFFLSFLLNIRRKSNSKIFGTSMKDQTWFVQGKTHKYTHPKYAKLLFINPKIISLSTQDVHAHSTSLYPAYHLIMGKFENNTQNIQDLSLRLQSALLQVATITKLLDPFSPLCFPALKARTKEERKKKLDVPI